MDAIVDANVVILMIDARDGVRAGPTSFGSHFGCWTSSRIVVNKWDGLKLDERHNIRLELERRLTFIDFAKIHFISALHGSGVGGLYGSLHRAYESATRGIKTSDLNTILQQAIADHQPPLVRGRRIKLLVCPSWWDKSSKDCPAW